jgi:hypothetical protein
MHYYTSLIVILIVAVNPSKLPKLGYPDEPEENPEPQGSGAKPPLRQHQDANE